MSKKDKPTPPKQYILDRLYQVWLANPELRVGQLIWNKTRNRDYFYDSDEDFIKVLEKE